LAEVKTARGEVKAKASEIKVLKDQLLRTKEQLGSAQMTIASMVSRSELDAAQALLNSQQQLMIENEERSRKSVDALQEQAREYKSEIDELKAAIQAIGPFSFTCNAPHRGTSHPAPKSFSHVCSLFIGNGAQTRTGDCQVCCNQYKYCIFRRTEGSCADNLPTSG
jgi:hypothetical protein